MRSGRASRTAVFVCQGRAVADGRLALGRFSDPVAEQLLREQEMKPVRLARGDTRAAQLGGRERLAVESVRACAEVVVPRTVVIDEAVTRAVQEGIEQAVVLGAGLDTRPWRLACLGGATVFCVDHPASQADARERVAAVTAMAERVVFVPVDLTTRGVDDALAAAGHDQEAPTVWVWEGVVPYLRRAEVAVTVAALAGRSARDSVLVVTYQSPSWVATVGRHTADLVARMARAEALTADEPWRSAWTSRAMARLLAAHGFVVSQDVDLLEVAASLGSPTRHTRSLRTGRVAVARFGDPPPGAS